MTSLHIAALILNLNKNICNRKKIQIGTINFELLHQDASHQISTADRYKVPTEYDEQIAANK